MPAGVIFLLNVMTQKQKLLFFSRRKLRIDQPALEFSFRGLNEMAEECVVKSTVSVSQSLTGYQAKLSSFISNKERFIQSKYKG